MELREFAETILYGSNLTSDKLLQPGELTDQYPGTAISAPQYPTRPKELAFGVGHSNEKVEFPNQNNIRDEKQRGIVLHFFANHELLAMELMALTILRFPNAPANFRMGVAKTILEEQRHMRLYMDRMQEFNVSFGEIAVNDFFWKCLSNMNSPMDYVTKLSMTFEQANLDFSYFYMNLMKKIGDNKTAEILQTVFEEEIGHVKHGVVWFDKWRDHSQSQWQCYTNELKLPLTPARAKGISFTHKARVDAGLTTNYIDELFVFSASKGRPPDIYFFNPCCELEVARGSIGFNPTQPIQYLQEDCAPLCLFLAAKDDIVLVPRKPSLEFLQKLKLCGFDLPEWQPYVNKKINISHFTQTSFGALKPWGHSPESFGFLKDFIPLCKTKPCPVNKNLYSKIYSAELSHSIWKEFSQYKDILSEQNSLPSICSNLNSVFDAIQNHLKYSDTVVLKAPFGSAGQNMKRVHSAQLPVNDINWINRILTEHDGLVVEPWFNRVADFSSQLKIENNQVIYLGDTRLLTDNRGQYIGTLMGKKILYLEEDIVKFLYKVNFASILKQISLFVGDKLLQLGFGGPFGIDVFIFRDMNSPQGFRIKFISEINPRFTMGRVALEISKRILPGISSLWQHLRVKDIESKFQTKQNFFEKITTEFPLEINHSFKPQIKSGALFTNDALQAKNTVTILLIGQENIEKYHLLFKKECHEHP
ncbi:MAG: DUF455 family protein [Bdellovibrionota bacterium]